MRLWKHFRFSLWTLVILIAVFSGVFVFWSDRSPWILVNTVEGYLPLRPFSENGNRLLAGSESGRTFEYEFPSGERIRTIRSHRGRVIPAYSSDYRSILAYGQDDPKANSIRVYDVLTGKQIFSQVHIGGERAGMSADGQVCVIQPFHSKNTFEYQFWDTRTGQLLTKPKFETVSGKFMAISNGGEYLATWESDPDYLPGVDLIWNFETEEECLRLKRHWLKPGISEIPSLIRFSPDGETMLRLEFLRLRGDDILELWSTKDWTKRTVSLGEYGIQGRCVCLFSADSTSIRLTPNGSRTVWIDVDSAEVQQTVSHGNACRSPDGGLIATTSGVFDASSGERLFSFPNAGGVAGFGYGCLPVGNPYVVRTSPSPVFSGNGRYLVCPGPNATIQIWRRRHGGSPLHLGPIITVVAAGLLLISVCLDMRKARKGNREEEAHGHNDD